MSKTTHDPTQPKPGAAAAGGAAAQVSANELDNLRRLPITPASTIPAVHVSYNGVPNEQWYSVPKLEGNQRAEYQNALRFLISKGDVKLKADLGASTPPVAVFQELLTEMTDGYDSKTVAVALANFLTDRNRATEGAVVAAIQKAKKNLIHESDDRPRLMQEYGPLAAIIQQRSESISEGIARAKEAAAAGGLDEKKDPNKK